jgi:hypothetical protein
MGRDRTDHRPAATRDHTVRPRRSRSGFPSNRRRYSMAGRPGTGDPTPSNRWHIGRPGRRFLSDSRLHRNNCARGSTRFRHSRTCSRRSTDHRRCRHTRSTSPRRNSHCSRFHCSTNQRSMPRQPHRVRPGCRMVRTDSGPPGTRTRWGRDRCSSPRRDRGSSRNRRSLGGSRLRRSFVWENSSRYENTLLPEDSR